MAKAMPAAVSQVRRAAKRAGLSEDDQNDLEIAIRDGDRRQAAALHEALCTSTGRFGARPSPEAWRRLLKGDG